MARAGSGPHLVMRLPQLLADLRTAEKGDRSEWPSGPPVFTGDLLGAGFTGHFTFFYFVESLQDSNLGGSNEAHCTGEETEAYSRQMACSVILKRKQTP